MPDADITALLNDWADGDKSSLEALTPLVYDQLRRIAARSFRGERPDHTLQATALVHEAYVKLVGVDVDWQGRAHFFALAARLMRRILVDHANSRRAGKRGGDAVHVPLDDVILVGPESGEEILELDDALSELAREDQRRADILELHYFGGLTYAELGDVLGLSSSTLDREMRFGKAWLRARLED